jgi:hypothetical protein
MDLGFLQKAKGYITELRTADEKRIAELEAACRAVIAAGRPHDTPEDWPDCCKCDKCLAWDRLNGVLK